MRRAIPFVFAVLLGCTDSGGGNSAPPSAMTAVVSVRLESEAVRLVWNYELPATTVEIRRSRYDADFGWFDEIELGTFPANNAEFVDGGVADARYRYRFRFVDDSSVTVAEVEREIGVPTTLIEAEPAQIVTDEPFMTALGDVDGDGFLEILGASNDGVGGFDTQPALMIGLDGLWAGGRVARDVRLADFDGDGDLDIIANTYSTLDDSASFAQLYWNDGTGFFDRDLDFDSMDIRGFGETILTFDFDNDGDLDIFLPYYSFDDPDEQSYLLRNDDGVFVDVTDLAGVAMRGISSAFRAEGAHAADLNDDGWIDFYVASHLFLNRGDGSFVDVRMDAGLPLSFDEGVRFLDWDLDGDLDLMLHHPNLGPELYELIGFDGTRAPVLPLYQLVPNAFPVLFGANRFGANVGDLNLDGYEDLLIASGNSDSVVLVNRIGYFEAASAFELGFPGFHTDTSAIGDLDRDGIPDIARRVGVSAGAVQFGLTRVDHMSSLRLLVTGNVGQANQQGRVVRISPMSEPNFVITRIVDGGSGYMSQGTYEILVGSPYPGEHKISVQFSDRVVVTVQEMGRFVEIRSNGQVLTN